MPTTLLPFVEVEARRDDEVCKGIAKSLASYVNTFNLTTLSRRATKRPFLFVSRREDLGGFVPKEIRISENENENEKEKENENEIQNENKNEIQNIMQAKSENHVENHVENEAVPNPNQPQPQMQTQNQPQIQTLPESPNHPPHSIPSNQQMVVEEESAAPLRLYRRFSSRGIQRVGAACFCFM